MELVKIIEAGEQNSERIQFKADVSENIGNYMSISTIQTEPGHVSSYIRHTYWFPDSNVQAGDLVVLYTKTGENFQRKNANGSTTWFFYWGKSSPLFTQHNSAVALMKIAGWKYKARD